MPPAARRDCFVATLLAMTRFGCHCERPEAISIKERSDAPPGSGAGGDPRSAPEKRRQIIAEPDDAAIRLRWALGLRCRLGKHRHRFGRALARFGRSGAFARF